MTTITIRHVPPEVRNTLAARAAQQGRSLQEYLLGEVSRLAERPSVPEVVASARERVRRTPRSVSVEDILDDRDADRR